MEQQRLLRLELLIGKENIEKLQNSTVMIAGLGGVGGTAFETLVRSGIGNFILIDSDVFDETNLNRQILCTKDVLGMKKTEAARMRALSIDESIRIRCFDTFLDESNMDAFLSLSPDVVVDAIDSVPSKVSLLAGCLKRSIPVVSSMGAGLRTDPTAIRIADISETFCDPLAKEVRRNLKKTGIGSGIKCVFSVEKPRSPVNGTIASICSVTSAFGCALAQAAIDSILN